MPAWKERDRDPKRLEQRRTDAIKLLLGTKLSKREVASTLGVSHTSVKSWWKAYVDGGMKMGALKASKHTGRPPLMDRNQRRRLDRPREGNNRELLHEDSAEAGPGGDSGPQGGVQPQRRRREVRRQREERIGNLGDAGRAHPFLQLPQRRGEKALHHQIEGGCCLIKFSLTAQ